MTQTLKRLAVIIEGETVRFRQTPYDSFAFGRQLTRRWIVSCTCGERYCDHRFKAIPEWKRFKEEG